MTIFRMNWVRWKYVLPRLIILLVIYLVVHFGLDPALRWGIITGGESSVGAKVELAEVVTSLWEGEIVLKELAIANPQSTMRNLLVTQDTQFLIDMNALLHGHVVITDGIVSGLQFDTDRATSGALTEVEAEEETGPSALDPMLKMASVMGEQWLDDLGGRLDVDIVDQLQSPRLAKELEMRWPQQIEQLKQQVTSIRTRGKELRKNILEVKENPLRGFEKLAGLQQELAALQKEVVSVQRQIGDLPKQAESDRQAVMVAREQDETLLRQKLQIGTMDGEGLTQTLLGKPVNDRLASALDWIRWAREQLPSSGIKTKELRGRGTTVRFTPPQPDYWVKRLQLEGVAQLGGKPLQMAGTLTGASSAPHLLDVPTRLKLRGSEALELNVEIELDRRGDIARDRLWLTCPQLAVTGRTLGNADKLAIEMGEGFANFRVELSLIGDQLDGKIVFAQESLKLTPRLAKSPNGQLTEVLGQALAGVQRLEAEVTLAGTLKKPRVKIDSDIGSQVASGLNSSVKRLVEERTEGLLAKSREQVDAQMQKLTQMREKAQQELLAQLGEGQELLGQLASLTGGSQGLPGGIPQLGKSLRLKGLLK